MPRVALSGIASSLAVLVALASCGGGGGSSPPASSGSAGGDILAGAFDTDRPLPPVVPVVYTASDGAQVTMRAFSGEVMVFFAAGTSQDGAASVVRGRGGAILAQVPQVGYYLVGVAPGSEGTFIASVLRGPGVVEASPDEALRPDGARSGAGAPRASSACPTPVLVPAGGAINYLNIPAGIGSVVVDGFDTPQSHGFEVVAADEQQVAGAPAGATGCAKFRIDLSRAAAGGETTAHAMNMAVLKAIAGSHVTAPGDPVLVNVSAGPHPEEDLDVDFFCRPPSLAPECEGISADEWHARWQRSIGQKLLVLASVLPDWRQNVILTKSMGNVHMELGGALAALRTTGHPGISGAVATELLADHVVLVGSLDRDPGTLDRFPATSPAQPGGMYSNYVRGPGCDDDVVTYTGAPPPGWNTPGTSASAPRVEAILETLLRQVRGLTVAGAIQAVKRAAKANGCALRYADALAVARGAATPVVFRGAVSAPIGQVSGCGATYSWSMTGTMQLTLQVASDGTVSGAADAARLVEHDVGTVTRCSGSCTTGSVEHDLVGPVGGKTTDLRATLADADVTLSFSGSVSGGQLTGSATGSHVFNISDNHGCSSDTTLSLSISPIVLQAVAPSLRAGGAVSAR